MAESSVETFKRDYMHGHDRPEAASILTLLDRWFDDYNESHPEGLEDEVPM